MTHINIFNENIQRGEVRITGRDDKLSDRAEHFFDQLIKLKIPPLYPLLDYFREVEFCRLLDTHFNHMTVADLKKQPECR